MGQERKISKYEEFAQELESQIHSGTFPVGGRIPSIRESSARRELSFTTVLEAYRLLENRGIIEAKPQSGYYVRARPENRAPEPDFSPHHGDPTSVSIDEVSLRLIEETLNMDYAQFGAALPDPTLLPVAKLNRILAELAREDMVQHGSGGTVQGREDLRVQIAQRAFSYGCDLSPEDIVITAGCTEALNLCLQAVCAPGDLVAIESPTYFGILMSLQAFHLRALEIPSHPRHGMSIDALRFAIENHPIKAVVAMTNFSNPTGSLMEDEDKRKLVELLAEREIPLIEDDINGEIYFGEHRPRVAKAYDRKGLVMLCSSFSKDLSSGFRIGWVAPGKFYPEVKRLKYTLNIRTSPLPQLAIARFLESGSYDHHLRRIRKAYARRVELMAQAVAKNFPEGTCITEPQGGFVLWVQLPESLDSLVLYREAMKAFIAIAPGYIFSPSRKFDDFIRLNAAGWSDKAEEDLSRLGKIATALAGARRLESEA
ncbi:MAG: PLP-dependent aminotransferase family protein [Rectinemataceae bacterium]